MIAVVIPCYKVKEQILDVLQGIGPECQSIYVVDDCCPEGSGTLVQDQCTDGRVKVIFHDKNRGVGGATLSGYSAALEDGAEVIVKLDGDGQMDPGFIPKLVAPVQTGEADYAKGNRFFDLDGLKPMPPVRLVGNAVLSFASKLSSGYWNIFDPTNGFTAIHAKVARTLPLHKISQRWFFESDLLFRLGIQRAVVCDVPMPATYRDETSSLKISRVLFIFSWKHMKNTLKRIFYSYFLRDFNVASIELFLGLVLLAFGTWTGVRHWEQSFATGQAATSGTVMLAALPIILGMQFILAFLGFDLRNVPTNVLHRRL
jgi:glycosyltransferase involved in cell wall biosynthesis